jgi:hypothetical protein
MEELFLASCNEGVLNICSKLIKKDVNIDCVDFTGQSGLMKVEIGLKRKLRVFREFNLFIHIFKACSGGHYGIVKLLLRSKANLNLEDPYGQNALFYAIGANNMNIIKLLLHYDINAKNYSKSCSLKPRDLGLTTSVVVHQQTENPVEPQIYDLLLSYERGLKPALNDFDSDDEPKRIYIAAKKEVPQKKKKKKGGKKK